MPSLLPSAAFPAALLLAVALPPALPGAQIVGGDWPQLLQVDGSFPGDRAGRAVALGGDFDGDGLADPVVGSPLASPGGLSEAGTVRVHSGLDGTVLLELHGATAGALFGVCLATVGDVNGDGVAELLVGAPYDAPGGRAEAGTATLYSGADGAADVVIGSHAAFNDTVRHAGRAVVVSGATGALIYNFAGPHDHAHFGFGVTGPGDLDLDGVPDIAVGGYGVETHAIANAGAVMAYSGADGSLLWQYDGLRLYAHRGEALAPAGDFDGDGVPDLLDGSQRSLGKPYALSAGAVAVHSGVDGAILFELRGSSDNQGLGSAVAPAGDLDGDGDDDLLVGSPGSDPSGKADAGELLVLGGGDGALLYRLPGATPADNLGLAAAGAADADGDGRLDYLVGAPGGDPGAGFDAGHAFLFSYRPLLQLSAASLSAAAGGRLEFALDFPLADAGLDYGLLFSKSGAGPSILAGLEIPLTQDSTFFHTTLGHYPSFLTGGQGLLDANGEALAVLDAAPGDLAAFAGLQFWVCAVSLQPGTGLIRSSAAASFSVLP